MEKKNFPSILVSKSSEKIFVRLCTSRTHHPPRKFTLKLSGNIQWPRPNSYMENITQFETVLSTYTFFFWFKRSLNNIWLLIFIITFVKHWVGMEWLPKLIKNMVGIFFFVLQVLLKKKVKNKKKLTSIVEF